MTDDDYGLPMRGSDGEFCGDCELLTEALRDYEMQCREAEDDHMHALCGFAGADVDAVDDFYLAKIKKLEHRRDCALDVLLKHQRLEHRDPE